MEKTPVERASGPINGTRSRRGMVMVGLIILLSVIAVGVDAWWSLRDADMTVSGYAALALGILGTIALGVGLMALLFYSHRHGYDDAVSRSEEPEERD